MRAHALVGGLAVLAAAGVANAQLVMDFQDLEQGGGGFAEWGHSYVHNNFEVWSDPNEPWPLTTPQTGNTSFYQGSTMMFNNTVDGVLHFQRVDRAAYSMASMDIANLFVGGSPVTVNFVGHKQGGGTVNATFTVPTGTGGYTYNFSGFDNITDLTWVQEGSFHQFDNITIVPTPGALAMLGLAGLAGVRRRR